MGKDDAHWTVLGSRIIYDSPWVRLRRTDVRLPDGSIIDGHHVIEVPRPAVGVVPLAADGRILLILHHRFITGTTGWEIPAGGFDPGDDLNSAAARELREETGHAAERFEHLGVYHPSNGLSNQTFNVCTGHDVTKVGEVEDTNEVMDVRWFARDAVAGLLRRNEIRDGLSLTALLWFFALPTIGP